MVTRCHLPTNTNETLYVYVSEHMLAVVTKYGLLASATMVIGKHVNERNVMSFVLTDVSEPASD